MKDKIEILRFHHSEFMFYIRFRNEFFKKKKSLNYEKNTKSDIFLKSSEMSCIDENFSLMIISGSNIHNRLHYIFEKNVKKNILYDF